MMPFLLPMARWGMVSAKAFAARFSDPFLRRAVPQMFSWEEAPVMMGMFLLAYLHNRNAGFPVGASLDFARALERRFLELGGEIQYDSQVETHSHAKWPGDRRTAVQRRGLRRGLS